MTRLLALLSYTFIFLTGATALVYEVIWQRYLSRLTGNDSLATALILGIFLGCLSCGYAFSGWLSLRVRRPLRAYAVIEGAIGLWALAFPALFDGVAAVSRGWSFAAPGWLLVEGGFCAFVLIGLPALCMGGTVPLLTRELAETLPRATRVHARIYGMNTAGAFVGVIAAGYYFVPTLGLPGALRSVAVINLLAAVFFAVFPESRREPQPTPALPINDPAAASAKRNSAWTLYAIAGLNGVAVMALENVLIRITNLTLGSSTYAFSLIVGVFVLSLALGSFAVGALRQLPRGLLFSTQALALVAWWLVYLTLDDWPYFAHLVRSTFQGNAIGFWAFQVTVFAVLLAVMIVPVGLLGTALPVIFHELKNDLQLVGWHSGRIFSANAAGCVLGSIVGGWLLFLPLDNPGVLAVAFCVVACSVCIASLSLGSRARLGATTLMLGSLFAAFGQVGFEKERFALGTFRMDRLLPYSYRGSDYFYEHFYRTHDVKFYDDGPEGTVAVLADKPENGLPPGLSEMLPGLPLPGAGGSTSAAPQMAITVNGKSDSHTLSDRETLRLSAHIPALWAERRTKALVIGLGTGVTAGELTLYPDVERIDVAELSSGVVNVLPLFGPFTHDVHRDPRLRLHVGDAFRLLGRSGDQWDFIISEPSNPWVTGVDLLFSAEFYQLAFDHLTENGLLLQWVQKYAIDTQTFGILMNTLRERFPNVCVYQGEPGDLLVLASKRPFTVNDQARGVAALQGNPAVAESLAEIGLKDFQELRNRERMGLLLVSDQLKGAGIETLDRPRVHYLAGKSRFIGTGLGELAGDISAQGTAVFASALFDQPMRMRLLTNSVAVP